MNGHRLRWDSAAKATVCDHFTALKLSAALALAIFRQWWVPSGIWYRIRAPRTAGAGDGHGSGVSFGKSRSHRSEKDVLVYAP